jgi:hypothetical protein
MDQQKASTPPSSPSDTEILPLPEAWPYPSATHVRRLTVVRLPDGTDALVPLLRIKGRWLEQAGFSVGRPVRVSVLPNRLVIDLIPPPKKSSDLPRTIDLSDCRY